MQRPFWDYFGRTLDDCRPYVKDRLLFTRYRAKALPCSKKIRSSSDLEAQISLKTGGDGRGRWKSLSGSKRHSGDNGWDRPVSTPKQNGNSRDVGRVESFARSTFMKHTHTL